MMQDIHEEEHKIILEEYTRLNHTIITGIVQRKIGKSYSINLGNAGGVILMLLMILSLLKFSIWNKKKA